jgi:hypothetical protein
MVEIVLGVEILHLVMLVTVSLIFICQGYSGKQNSSREDCGASSDG